jgi:hypothetical protein
MDSIVEFLDHSLVDRVHHDKGRLLPLSYNPISTLHAVHLERNSQSRPLGSDLLRGLEAFRTVSKVLLASSAGIWGVEVNYY